MLEMPTMSINPEDREKESFDIIGNKIKDLGKFDENDQTHTIDNIPLNQKDKADGVNAININYEEKNNKTKISINKSYIDGHSSSYELKYTNKDGKNIISLGGKEVTNDGKITTKDDVIIDNETDLNTGFKPIETRINETILDRKNQEEKTKQQKIQNIMDLANLENGDADSELEQKLKTV